MISAITASILLSALAAINAFAPPYEPPIIPTRGSSVLSCVTYGLFARYEISARVSLTSASIAFIAISPVDSPKPLAVHVITT